MPKTKTNMKRNRTRTYKKKGGYIFFPSDTDKEFGFGKSSSANNASNSSESFNLFGLFTTDPKDAIVKNETEISELQEEINKLKDENDKLRQQVKPGSNPVAPPHVAPIYPTDQAPNTNTDPRLAPAAMGGKKRRQNKK